MGREELFSRIIMACRVVGIVSIGYCLDIVIDSFSNKS